MMSLTLGVTVPAGAQVAVTVDTAPAVDIPGTGPSGRVVFEVAVGATRLSSGTVVVADRGASALRFFDRNGQPVRAVGRRGSGPNEFRRVDWLGQCGPDSLYVWDRVGQQLSVIDSAGRFVYQGRFPGDTGVRGVPISLSCSRNGVLVLLMSAPIKPAPEAPFLERGRSNVVRTTSRGTDLRVVTAVPGSERVALEDAILASPLGRTTSVAVWKDRLYVGTGDKAAVSVYVLDGALITTLPVGIATRKPTRQEFDLAIDRLPRPTAQDLWVPMRDRLQRLPLPEVLPPYRKVYVDPEGLLWAVVSPDGAGSTALAVVDAAGRTVGNVVLPRTVTVLDIDREFILASYDDGAGEPHVLAFRIRRTR